jgi:hypothetical protein
LLLEDESDVNSHHTHNQIDLISHGRGHDIKLLRGVMGKLDITFSGKRGSMVLEKIIKRWKIIPQTGVIVIETDCMRSASMRFASHDGSAETQRPE